jgi:hypothetical protein
MERIAHKSGSFKEGADWDIEQHVSMTPNQRLRAAKILRERVYGKNVKDVREWHRNR